MRMEIVNCLLVFNHKRPIDTAVAFVRKQDTGLYSLDNNAGIGDGGPAPRSTVED